MSEMRARLVVEADASSIVGETRRASGGLDDMSAAAAKTAGSMKEVAAQGEVAERMQKRLNATFSNFGSERRSAQDSAAAFEDAFRARDAYRALEASIDPLVRAERELAAAQQVVNSAVSSGSVSQKEAAGRLQVLHDRYEAIVSAQRRVSSSSGFGSASASGRSARDSASVFEAAFREQDAYRALKESIDPLIRAERELAAAQKLVNSAVASGSVTQEEAARDLRVLQGRYDAVAAAQARAARGGRSRGMVQGGVQNAAFQAQDIAVQLQMGTAASVVMAQQLPQLLGGFGVMGAVIGAVVAVGVPLANMLLNAGEAAGTLDQRMGTLDSSLQAISGHIKILRDQDLSLTFGSMAGDVRALTEDLMALERVAELKALRGTLDELMSEQLSPNGWQKFIATLSSYMAPGVSRSQVVEGISSENYDELTQGRGPDYNEFRKRRWNIESSARAGEVDTVVSEVMSLIDEFAGSGAITDMNDELLGMLTTLGAVARQTAEIEALRNNTGRDAYLDKEIGTLTAAYEQQAELARTIVGFGANSAEVEEVRTRQAREALSLKLREMGVVRDSAREQEALAALDEALAADAAARSQERQRAIAQTLTGLSNELAVTQAIIGHGEDGVAVERLRTEQARETLRLKLAEIGATEEQIKQAEDLLERGRAAARQARIAKAETEAGNSLGSMRREAEINEAMLRHGRDSLVVKRLQVEAAREEYIQSLETLKVSQATKDALLAQWDATRGTTSADPFGLQAAAQQILETQTRSIAMLRLEQSLMGQSESTRRRVLALYEAELEIRRRGFDAESDLADRIREGALANADLTAEVSRQSDAWGTVQSSAESAIDGIVDAALDADIPGLFEGIASEIEGILAELAIKNPLKNALLGKDLPTFSDVGGLSGVWSRLTGQAPAIDPSEVAAQAAAQSVATMQVTAANVIIGGAGVSQFLATGTVANMSGQPGGGIGADWLSYSNQGAIRSQPISDKLKTAMSFLEEMGVKMEVFSGGQDGIGSGGARTGSTRHDHGNAADVIFSKDGRKLDWSNPADLPIYQEIVSRARANGVTGFGAGPGYMRPGSMHVGYGAPAVWGAGGQGSAAPDWLRQAYATPVRNDMPDASAAARALGALSSTASSATQDLGALGTGFDAFGQILAGLGGGKASDAAGGGGMFWGLASAIAGDLGIQGFAVGGPTGGNDPRKVAGLVHEQEYVFDAASTARIGVANLEAIRQGRMAGYASGGYTSKASGYSFLSGSGRGGQSASLPADAFGPANIVVNDYSGQDISAEYQSDGRGGRQMTMVIGQQMAAAMSQPGNPARQKLKQYGARDRVTRR